MNFIFLPFFRVSLLFVAVLQLVSCGGLSMFEPPKIKNPAEHKKEMVSDDEALGIAAIGQGSTTGRFETTFTNNEIAEIEKNIEWAPEDPNVPFQTGISKNKQYKTWTKNYRKAIAEARNQGKPLLVWFSDSRGSAISNRLSTELFSRADFDTWVRDRFVTLLVDKAHYTNLTSKAKQDKAKRYDLSMRRRFEVKGSPEVLIVNANGDVQSRYRGYTRDTWETYWGKLKQAHEGAKNYYGGWRERMEKKGYRMWHTLGKEKSVFAKMTKRSKDSITLVTPNGNRQSLLILNLSNEDQAWLNQQ